jgi:hypothetical protein
MVVPDQEQADITVRTALSRAVQLNANQPYSYNLEEMTKMLTDEMAAQ